MTYPRCTELYILARDKCASLFVQSISGNIAFRKPFQSSLLYLITAQHYPRCTPVYILARWSSLFVKSISGTIAFRKPFQSSLLYLITARYYPRCSPLYVLARAKCSHLFVKIIREKVFGKPFITWSIESTSGSRLP
jgi:hypothetical protein